MTHSFPTRRSSDLPAHACANNTKTLLRTPAVRGCHPWHRAGRPGEAHDAPGRRIPALPRRPGQQPRRSEEHTSELQSLMRISYAVFCLKKKNTTKTKQKQGKTK